MKIIVGLGNPGENYALNRHNTGFRVVDYMTQKYGINIRQNKSRATIGKGEIAGQEVILAKPKTYVNNSGIAVKGLMQNFQVAISDIIVIHDDLDLPLGQIRVRPRGSSGGHKGLQSIIAEIGSGDFNRIKIGIGRPDEGLTQRASEDEIVSYVLSDFNNKEEEVISQAISKADEVIGYVLSNGIMPAMNKYNKGKKKGNRTDNEFSGDSLNSQTDSQQSYI